MKIGACSNFGRGYTFLNERLAKHYGIEGIQETNSARIDKGGQALAGVDSRECFDFDL